MSIENLIEQGYRDLNASTNLSEKSNILFNIIKLKVRKVQSENLYRDIKYFFDLYIESLKLADFGYDNYNYSKIEELIELLPSNQQVSILQYIMSVSARELPEHERTWFISRKHKSEIKLIIESRNFHLYPKVVFLYLGQSVTRLLLGLFVLFILTCLVLLPAPISWMAVFEVSYSYYSEYTLTNHIINVVALFADLENDFKVKPNGLLGLFLLFIGKILFVTFIINFFYFKISDKISQQ